MYVFACDMVSRCHLLVSCVSGGTSVANLEGRWNWILECLQRNHRTQPRRPEVQKLWVLQKGRPQQSPLLPTRNCGTSPESSRQNQPFLSLVPGVQAALRCHLNQTITLYLTVTHVTSLSNFLQQTINFICLRVKSCNTILQLKYKFFELLE